MTHTQQHSGNRPPSVGHIQVSGSRAPLSRLSAVHFWGQYFTQAATPANCLCGMILRRRFAVSAGGDSRRFSLHCRNFGPRAGKTWRSRPPSLPRPCNHSPPARPLPEPDRSLEFRSTRPSHPFDHPSMKIGAASAARRNSPPMDHSACFFMRSNGPETHRFSGW